MDSKRSFFEVNFCGPVKKKKKGGGAKVGLFKKRGDNGSYEGREGKGSHE